MTSLDTRISRRDILKGISAVAACVVAPPVLLIADSRQVVSFEEALANISLRPRYINQLVEKESSPYVEKVIYDHDKSLAKKALFDDVKEALEIEANRALNDPVLLDQWAKGIKEIGDPLFKNLDLEEIKKKLPDYIKSPEGRKQLEDKVEQELKAKSYSKMDLAGAYTHPKQLQFGKKSKSTVYIFGDSFEAHSSGDKKVLLPFFGEVPIKITPTEERIRVFLHHEYVHAEDNYKGINLRQGLVINDSNYEHIDDNALDFVAETRAYIAQIDFSRKFNKKCGTPLERYHPAYLEAVFTFLDSLVLNNPKPESLNPYDRKLVEYQRREVDKMLGEIEQISGSIKQKVTIKC